MEISFARAQEQHAADLAALQTAVAQHLTARHGRGHWSVMTSAEGVRRAIQSSYVLVACEHHLPVATLTLATKKPWAIDPAYFAPAKRPLYLVNMAVAVELQGQGIGRRLLGEGVAVAKAWPADAIWLDAYDAAVGAGGFYARCGFREVGRVVYRRTPLVYFELDL